MIKGIQDFFCDIPLVIVGSGMSCALDPRFGMPKLERVLTKEIIPDPQEPKQVQQWAAVCELLNNGTGLEAALDSVTDNTLLHKVTCATGLFIASIDREWALQIADGAAIWPATSLFKLLVDTLPESDPVLHVLTPNYDTLIEHACDANEILYSNGFIGGMCRKLSWYATDQSMRTTKKATKGKRFIHDRKLQKHIRLYKVHGSLSFFFHKDSVVENNAWMWDPPGFASRVMVTPGLSKYRRLQDYRRELLGPADAAIERANRFLFLGYGFNDTHLERYIREKLVNGGCEALVIARDLNGQMESLLSEAPNIWLVCRDQESDAEGTRIFNSKYPKGVGIPEIQLWDIRVFTDEILGG
jgi:hypothetical protein